MKFDRASGILLHPTSLPGPYGIGDLGSAAINWIDFLVQAGCGLWQVLPLGPTGYGDSPYQCFSAFAGNPYLISPEVLFEDGFISKADLEITSGISNDKVNYGVIIPWKLAILDKAFARFEGVASASIRKEYFEFQEQQSGWLFDFALFMTLKEAHDGAPWVTWAEPLRDHEPVAIQSAQQKYQDEIQRQIFRQFLFFRQWSRVRAHAANQDIKIIGDIPIFVAHDSSDVWTHRDLFYLDHSGNPSVVAGVPPDYFSETGQLWGNPLYRWDLHADQGYRWWLDRIKAVLMQVDLIRLDHFRGFAGYWEIPGDALTAEKGRWVTGPGDEFFQAVEAELGELPLIAEDLGVITPDVVAMREKFHLPGMKVLQFAFTGDPNDPFLPHNYPQNCVVYTGTHDNDTSLGWYKRVPEDERRFYRQYLHREGSDVSWDLIRSCWSSVAVFALAPMQDFLKLDNQARMNYPGNPSGNWSWRMPDDALSPELATSIRKLNFLYSRELSTPNSDQDRT